MGERETVTAGAWYADKAGDWVRRFHPEAGRYWLCAVVFGYHMGGWSVWTGSDGIEPSARGEETGQAGRDAADAALRAAGVVLL